MLEPNIIVLYVNNLAASSQFYQNLLKMQPHEASATFHMFKLSNGMGVGLKARYVVEPPANDNSSRDGELAFIVNNNTEVDELFSEWQSKEINMLQLPTILTFGYTFVALDPDGNRLRVVSIRKA